jgi:hypothetical protein
VPMLSSHSSVDSSAPSSSSSSSYRNAPSRSSPDHLSLSHRLATSRSPSPAPGGSVGGCWLRVRVETMRAQKHGNVGQSQSVLIVNDPIIYLHPQAAHPIAQRSAEAGGRGASGESC